MASGRLLAKQPLECCSCVAESHTLTRISPCEVHGIDAEGNVILRRQLKRRYVLAFFQKQLPCLLGIEACASSHHWSRELQALGSHGSPGAASLRKASLIPLLHQSELTI